MGSVGSISLYLSSVINKTIKTSASKQLYSISDISTLAFENSQQVNIKSTDMARQRPGSEKQYEANISSPDLPPSYEDTIKTGQPGGFVDPNVKTIVRVVQVQMPELGPQPVRLMCPSCQMEITTRTSSKPSMIAWSHSLILCFTMLWPCFCLPFCVDSLQNVKHKCPSCKVVLGRYRETCRNGTSNVESLLQP